MSGILPKAMRLEEFFRRLASAEAVASFEGAYDLLCSTLNQVENEHSGLPNEPDQWMTLDRLFPPQSDRMSSVSGCTVKRFDSLKHITYIATNGAIEIRSKRRKAGAIEVHFTKAGSDGKRISDVFPKLASENL